MSRRFYGAIGFVKMVETAPGVMREENTESNYSGNIIKNVVKSQDSKNLNRNLVLDNRLSIVADPFAEQNFHAMRYVVWMGARWEITSVEVSRPRLILTIGGVYNDQQTRSTQETTIDPR